MKFSVITPAYNQGKFIEETIKSVVFQKGDFDIEYLVFDGGSTDGTVKILKDYERKLKNNPRVKFYWQSKRDLGQANAINQGINRSTGDIVSYINSDDYYLPGAFQTAANYFNSHPKKQWLVGNCRVTDPKLAWTFVLKHLWPIQFFKSALFVFNTINQPSVFLKKDLVTRVGLFEEKYRYAFDYDYWLRCIRESLPGRVYKDLAVFRIHPASKGSAGYINQFEEDWKVFTNNSPKKILYFIHLAANKSVKAFYKYLK